ncbi:MAG: hypothetical protein H7228_02440 [Polaromonas sp.]|nr:hypothetical protein [Polaromonas sp.]
MPAYFKHVTRDLMCDLAEVYKIANKARVGLYGNPDFASMVKAVANVEPSENEVTVNGRDACGSSVHEIMTKRAQLLKTVRE